MKIHNSNDTTPTILLEFDDELSSYLFEDISITPKEKIPSSYTGMSGGGVGGGGGGGGGGGHA